MDSLYIFDIKSLIRYMVSKYFLPFPVDFTFAVQRFFGLRHLFLLSLVEHFVSNLRIIAKTNIKAFTTFVFF